MIGHLGKKSLFKDTQETSEYSRLMGIIPTLRHLGYVGT